MSGSLIIQDGKLVGAVTMSMLTILPLGMAFYKVPIGFGLALSRNTAAMMRYVQLDETQKQDILNCAHNVRSEKEVYSIVACLSNGAVHNKKI